MNICLNMETYSDECELFYDLDADEISELKCDSDGVCLMEFEECPYYAEVYGWLEDDFEED